MSSAMLQVRENKLSQKTNILRDHAVRPAPL